MDKAKKGKGSISYLYICGYSILFLETDDEVPGTGATQAQGSGGTATSASDEPSDQYYY